MNISSMDISLVCLTKRTGHSLDVVLQFHSSLVMFLSVCLRTVWRQSWRPNRRGCSASAASAVGGQRDCCGLHSFWTQAIHYYSHHQVLIYTIASIWVHEPVIIFVISGSTAIEVLIVYLKNVIIRNHHYHHHPIVVVRVWIYFCLCLNCFSGTTWLCSTWWQCRAMGPKSSSEWAVNYRGQEPLFDSMSLSQLWWSVVTVRWILTLDLNAWVFNNNPF